MADVPELDVAQFEQWRETGRPHLLLDVRLAEEVERGSLKGALHIPMHEIPTRLAEIPREAPIVVMCAHGERSWIVANYLLTAGFSDVYNLEGGISCISLRSPDMPGRR